MVIIVIIYNKDISLGQPPVNQHLQGWLMVSQSHRTQSQKPEWRPCLKVCLLQIPPLLSLESVLSLSFSLPMWESEQDSRLMLNIHIMFVPVELVAKSFDVTPKKKKQKAQSYSKGECGHWPIKAEVLSTNSLMITHSKAHKDCYCPDTQIVVWLSVYDMSIGKFYWCVLHSVWLRTGSLSLAMNSPPYYRPHVHSFQSHPQVSVLSRTLCCVFKQAYSKLYSCFTVCPEILFSDMFVNTNTSQGRHLGFV